jgi:hypothetical protein
MPTTEFLQLIVVAALAGYVGYLLGRATAKDTGRPAIPSPLPGPDADADTSRQRTSPPPPASADGTPANGRPPPRRSSAPPPAAAGLMTRDE